MPVDAIKVDQSQPTVAPYAREVINAKNLARQAYEAITRVKAAMDHMTDGVAAWTNLELLCGVTAGSGQTLYNLFAGSISGMTGASTTADFKNITERVV